MGSEAGAVAVVIGVDDLGQFVVVDDRERQRQLSATVRSGCQHVRLGSDGGGDGGHHLLADRVERRVRDLSEQLLEVVEDEAWPLRQHGEGRVGSHRPDRFHTTGGHRGEDELQFLVAVAEHLLTPEHALVAEHDVFAVGQILEFHETLVEPLTVGMLGREFRLDLLVVDDATPSRVDQEHPSGLQATLGHHLRRVDVDDPDLRCHDDQVVVRHPVATRPEPVSVEDRADHLAIGEGHARWTIPRFHERGVEAVEVPAFGIHRVVVLPCLGDHHQDGVVERPTGQVQQFEDLIESGSVARARRADREGALEVGQMRRGGHRLASAHPVLVALDRVDLAVVRHIAVRVRERPGRERVGRESGVDQEEGALGALIGEVRVEVGQLGGGEHPLVDERPR